MLEILSYDQVRNQAQDGDLLFLTINKRDILSRITGLVTGSKYSHVAFLFWYRDRLMVVESTTHGGIRIITASHYGNRMMSLIPAPKVWNEIEASVLEKSGTTEYGWFSAAYIGLREFMFNHFNVSLPQNRSNRNLACSEFVAQHLGLLDSDVSPEILLNRLTKV